MDFIIKPFEDLFKKHSYVWETSPNKVNIFSIRSKDREVNKFNDHIFLVYKDIKGVWHINQWSCTTDPGLSQLLNPSNSKGTAILVPGQYKNVYKMDLHNGKYEAICQRLGEVKVYRDSNRNSTHDFSQSTIDKGFFGINIHKAGEHSTQVDGWSAGCTVFQKRKDFDNFMVLCRLHKSIHGNKFTYTLFDEINI